VISFPRPVLLSLLSIVVLGACDDRDVEPPVITVTAPSENAYFAVFDTVEVAYQVSDDRGVESVTVKLVNQDFIPVAGQVTQSIGKLSHSGIALLVIDNRQLESGKYFILVTATDGTNDRNAFREIHVAAHPFALRAVLMADRNSSGQGTLYRVDSLYGSITPFAMPGQDIGRVCVSSAWDRVTVAGAKGTGIVQYDLLGTGQRWTASANNQPPAATYHDMVSDGANLFLSLYTREVRGYTLDGALILNRQFDNDRPYTLYADERHVMVELREIGGGQNRLMVLRQGNFSEKWLVTLPMEIAAICRRSGSEVFIFGNQDGQAKVLLYDAESNGWWEPRQLPQGRVLHAVKGEGQTYYLALESGLYAYTYSPNYLNSIRTGEVFQRLVFNRAERLLLGAKGSSLLVMAPQQGAVLSELNHSDSITDLDIRYTK